MMRIESISEKPDRTGRFKVVLVDGSVLRLYPQTIADHGLCSGAELDDSQLKSLRTDAGRMSAKMRAVRILAAANVSSSDLEHRLIQKGENADHAKETVAWMQGLNLLDDAATARHIVESCAAKGYGKARAKQMLYEKRIPRQLWDQALENFPQQTDAIVAFLRLRLGEDRDPKSVKRATDALLRRGHSYSEIRNGLRELDLEADDFQEDF